MKPVEWDVKWDDIRHTAKTRLSKTSDGEGLFASLDKLANRLSKFGLPPRLATVTYHYGDLIVRDPMDRTSSESRVDSTDINPIHSQLQLPAGDVLPREYAYATIPLALVMENAAEVFYPANEFKDISTHLHPIKILRPGDYLGLFETLSFRTSRLHIGHSPWAVTAGARSIAFSPSTVVKDFEEKLKEILNGLLNDSAKIKIYGHEAPDLGSHFELAKVIACNLSPGWSVKILLFSKDWFCDDRSRTTITAKHCNELETLRRDLDCYLFRIGWTNAAPLVGSATYNDFLCEWKKLHPKKNKNQKRVDTFTPTRTARLGYQIYEIDRGLRPAMIDVCHVVGSEHDFRYFQELAPINDLFLAMTLTASKLRMRERVTMFLPATPSCGVPAFHTTRDPDSDTGDSLIRESKRTKFMEILGHLLQGSAFPAQAINPDRVHLISNKNQPLISTKGSAIDVARLEKSRYTEIPIPETWWLTLTDEHKEACHRLGINTPSVYETLFCTPLKLREHMSWSIVFELRDPT